MAKKLVKKGEKVATSGGKPVKKKKAAPPAKEKVPGLDVGKKSGKRVVEFINQFLIDQKHLMFQDPRKMHDDDGLMKVIGTEFPLKESFQEMSAYRNYFNGALAGMGEPPYIDGNKAPPEKRLYSRERAMQMWEKGTLKPKCGAMPDSLKKKPPKEDKKAAKNKK